MVGSRSDCDLYLMFVGSLCGNRNSVTFCLIRTNSGGKQRLDVKTVFSALLHQTPMAVWREATSFICYIYSVYISNRSIRSNSQIY